MERNAGSCVNHSNVAANFDRENSTVMALSELQALEDDRLASIEAKRQAAVAAEHQAWMEAQRLEHEALENARLQAAHSLAAQQAAHAQAIAQEQARIAWAENEARQQHDARLRAEQARIDAQIRVAERRARRKWPLLVVPSLVLAMGAIGWLGWQSDVRAQQEALAAEVAQAEQEQAAEERAATMAAITEKLDRLEAQRAEMLADLSSLDAKLISAKDEGDRARLQAEKEALEAKIAEQNAAVEKSGGQGTRRPIKPRTPKPPKTDKGSDTVTADADPPSTGRRDPIVLSGDKPLDGLER